MLTAITHTPSPALNQGELTFLPRQPIDFAQALLQHTAYCDLLRRCGVRVITYDKNHVLPDSVFVEDTAFVLDEIGVIMPMGVASRQEETRLIQTELAKFREIKQIKHPARLEGGDILRIGKHLYVGVTSRTNTSGVMALAQMVKPYGYDVMGVNVTGCLHLKTGCTALDDQTILINPAWVDPEPFARFRLMSVPEGEPFAANVLRIGNTICMHSGFAKTREMVEQHGYDVQVTNISEFQKAEAGLTCMSLIFTH